MSQPAYDKLVLKLGGDGLSYGRFRLRDNIEARSTPGSSVALID